MDEARQKFVFVTGPYSGKTKQEEEANIQRAIDIGRIVFQN